MKHVYFLLAALFMSIGQVWAQTDISGGTVTQIPAQDYTGSAIEPTVTVTVSGTTLTPGTDYSVSYTNNTNAGTNSAVATVTGINSYTGTLTANFTINPADISAATIAPIDPQVYTGDPIEPTLEVAMGATPLALTTDYTVAYANNREVGTATATITGQGNYTGTKDASFTIEAYNILGATVEPIEAQTYTGEAIEPVLSVTANGNPLVLNTDYTVAYTENTDAGQNTAVATITGTGQYTGTKTVNFTITPMNISGATIAPVDPQTFTGEAIEPALTVTMNGQPLTLNTDYTVVYTENTDAGENTGVATITGEGNYTGTQTVNFTINPMDIATATVTPIEDQPYTGNPIEPELEVKMGTTTLVKGTDYTVAYTVNTAVGANTAVATITGTGNYTGTLTANFSIIAATITDADIQAIPEQKYTGEAVEPQVKVVVSGKTLQLGTDYTVAYSNNTNKSTQAQVTVTGTGNYQGTANALFTITDNPQPPTPEPGEGTAYTIKLTIAPGIVSDYLSDTYNLTTGGDRFSILFSLDSVSIGYLTGDDIVLMVNGKRENYNVINKTDGSVYYSYFPAEGVDQTIEITLSKNVIVIPRVEGATMNPRPGTYVVELGQPFAFSLTLNDDFDRSNVVVRVDGEELQPSSVLRSMTYSYVIPNVRRSMVIEVLGVKNNDDATGNAALEEDVKVYSSNNTLYVEVTQPSNVEVYTVTGLLKEKRQISGLESIQLNQGIYIVKINDNVYKVMVK